MKKNIIKTFSTVFILTFVAKVLGLLRDIVMANFYGTGMEATALFTALKIPTQIVDLVLSSAIVSTFVPVFNEVLKKEGKEKANSFANSFIHTIMLIATGISVVGMVFAPQIVKLLAGGFEPELYELTVKLITITFPMVIFTAMAFSFVGFLQSYGEFNVPAMISGVSNLVVILFLLIDRNRAGIHGVAVCMVIAWLLQVIIQLPWAKKFGYPFRFQIDWKNPNLKKVFLLAIPILISTAVLPVNNLISTRLASGMGESAIATLEYAYKLYVVIAGVFTYAIGNIIFPELSRTSTEQDKKEFRELMQKAMHLLTFLLIPLTVGIILYRSEIVSLLYQRGEFDATSTMQTAGALFYYAIGIVGAGFVEIMNKSFYAKQDTKTPLVVGLGMILCNLVLSIALSRTQLAFYGLALATSITALLNALVLTVLANRKTQGLWDKDLGKYIGSIFLATIGMALVVWNINHGLAGVLGGSMGKEIVRVILGAGFGFVFYVALTTLLGVNEWKELVRKEK